MSPATGKIEESNVQKTGISSESNKQPLKERFNYSRFRSILGVLIVFVSAFFYTLCNVFVQIADDVDPFNIAMYRFAFILAIAAPMVICKNLNPFPKGFRIKLIARSILGSSSLILHYYGLKHMPIADVNMVAASSPFFTVIFARIFLKEKIKYTDALNLILAFVGIFFIIKPNFVFGYDEGVEKRGPGYFGAAIGVIAAALILSNVYVLLRLLKDLPYETVVFNFGLIGTLNATVATIIFSQPKIPESGMDGLLVIAIGVLSFVSQTALTLAVKFESASLVSLMRKALDVLFSFLFQVLLFKDIPGMYSIVGATLIALVIFCSGARKILEDKGGKDGKDGKEDSGGVMVKVLKMALCVKVEKKADEQI